MKTTINKQLKQKNKLLLTKKLSIAIAGPVLFMLCASLLFMACRKKTVTPPDQMDLPCNEVKSVTPTGKLSISTDGSTFSYTGKDGNNVRITADNIYFTKDNYPVFVVHLWFDGWHHENLNSKHIKDRDNPVRTIMFENGLKVTMTAASLTSPVLSINIYEGSECHLMNVKCDKLYYSIVNDAARVQELDNKEADGETATIEFTGDGALFVNIYNEATPGNKVHKRVPLGRLNKNEEKTVHDLYDDPKLPHT